jgi:hypothetical protein
MNMNENEWNLRSSCGNTNLGIKLLIQRPVFKSSFRFGEWIVNNFPRNTFQMKSYLLVIFRKLVIQQFA